MNTRWQSVRAHTITAVLVTAVTVSQAATTWAQLAVGHASHARVKSEVRRGPHLHARMHSRTEAARKQSLYNAIDVSLTTGADSASVLDLFTRPKQDTQPRLELAKKILLRPTNVRTTTKPVSLFSKPTKLTLPVRTTQTNVKATASNRKTRRVAVAATTAQPVLAAAAAPTNPRPALQVGHVSNDDAPMPWWLLVLIVGSTAAILLLLVSLQRRRRRRA